MKLRLPHKFQAALMAALASVSFTTFSTGTAFATTLEDAALGLDDFTTASVQAAQTDGWRLSNISGSDTGVYTTTTSQARIDKNGESWATQNGDRCLWSAVVTFDINTLPTNTTGTLIEAVKTFGTTANGDFLEGIGYDSNGNVKLEGAWTNGAYSGLTTTSDLRSYADANGLVTVGLTYHSGSNGTAVYVWDDQRVQVGGLRSTNKVNGNLVLVLANKGNVEISNLYLFDNTVDTADMRSMMKDAGAYYWTGSTDGNWDAATKNWTHYGSSVAVAIGTNGGNAHTNVVFGADESITNKTVTLAAATTVGSLTVSGGDYTFNLNGNLTTSGITIAQGASLTSAGSGSITGTLAGAGTYILPTNSTTLGVTLGNDWTGTVRFRNVAFSGTNLANYVNAGKTSWVEMYGITGGYLYEWNRSDACAVNIKLNNPNDQTPAWIWNQGSGNTNNTITFTGQWAGTGTFKKTASYHQSFSFKGDISQWMGEFLFATTGGKTTDLTFAEGATAVNIAITKDASSNGTLNVNVGDGTNSFTTTFSKAVNASALTVKAQANATFEKAVTAASLAVGTNRSTGATATFNGDLTLSGNLTLNGTQAAPASVALNGNTSVGNLDLSNANNAHGTVTLATGKTLKVSGGMWMTTAATLVLAENATFEKGTELSVVGLSNGGSLSNTGSDTYNLNNSGYTLTNVQATIKTASADVQLRFDNSKLVTSQTITLKNLQSVFSGMDIGGGTTTVGASDATGTVTLGAVTLSGGNLALADHVTGSVSSIDVTGTSAISGGTLSMGGTITTEANTTLTLGGTVLFANGGIASSGTGTLAFGESVKFDIHQLTEGENHTYTLFTGNAVDLTSLNATAADHITGVITTGRTWTFNANGQVSYEILSRNLVWNQNGGAGIWTTDVSEQPWQISGAYPPVPTYFSNGDAVTFSYTAEPAVATLGSDVTVSTMTLDEDTPNVTVNNGGSHSFSVEVLDIKSGTLTTNTAMTANDVTVSGSLTTNAEMTVNVVTIEDGGVWNMGGHLDLTAITYSNEGTLNVMSGAAVTISKDTDTSAITGQGTLNLSVGTEVIQGYAPTFKAGSPFTGTLVYNEGNIGNHDSYVTLDNTFQGTLELHGRMNGHSMNLGGATTLRLVGDRSSNVTGIWDGGNNMTIAQPLGVIGDYQVEIYANATTTISGTVNSGTNKVGRLTKVRNGTMTFNGAVALAEFTTPGGTVNFNSSASLDRININGGTVNLAGGATADYSLGQAWISGGSLAIGANGVNSLTATDLVVKSTGTLSSAAAAATVFDVTNFDVSNYNTNFTLQNVTLNVSGAATAAVLNTAQNEDQATVTVGSNATLNLNGSVVWNKQDTEHSKLDYVNLTINNGGTANVNGVAANILNNATVNAGGRLNFKSGTSTEIKGALTVGGIVDNSGAVTFSTGTVATGQVGTLTGTGTYNLTGTLATEGTGTLKIADAIIHGAEGAAITGNVEIAGGTFTSPLTLGGEGSTITVTKVFYVDTTSDEDLVFAGTMVLDALESTGAAYSGGQQSTDNGFLTSTGTVKVFNVIDGSGYINMQSLGTVTYNGAAGILAPDGTFTAAGGNDTIFHVRTATATAETYSYAQGVHPDTFNAVSLDAAGVAFNIDSTAAALTKLTVMEAASGTVTIGDSATIDAVETGNGLTFVGSGTLTLGKDDAATAPISGTGALTFNGPAVTLYGDNSTFTGDLTISGGTVTVANDLALGSMVAGTRTVQLAGGTLDVNGHEGTGTGYTVEFAGGTLTNTGASHGSSHRQLVAFATITADSEISNATGHEMGFGTSQFTPITVTFEEGAKLDKTGTGTFWVSNATVSGEGGFKVSEGTLHFQQGGTYAATDLEMAGGTVAGTLNLAGNITIDTTEDSTLSAVITGTNRTVTMEGTGTLTLSGANTFSGGLTVNGGTVEMGNNNALGNADNAITIGQDGVIDLKGHDNVAYAYTLAGGTLQNTGSATGAGKKQTKGLTLTANSTIGGTGDFQIIAGDYAATTIDLGNKTLTKTGANTVHFVNSTITEGTVQVDAGALDFRTDHGSNTVKADIVLNGGGTALTGGFKYADSETAVTRNLTVNQSATTSAAITIGNNVTLATSVAEHQVLTLGGAITGTGNFSLSGPGTLKLAGSDMISANTLTFNSGSTLDVSNIAQMAGITVNLASYTGSASYSNLNITGLNSGLTYKLVNDGSHVAITFASQQVTPPTPTSPNLGKVMYVGDSITDGVTSGSDHAKSWRYSFFQVLADGGIGQTEQGYYQHTQSSGAITETTYGGRDFENNHSARASARSWETAGVPTSEKGGDRYDYSSILNWLGQSPTKRNGADYPDDKPVYKDENAPNTYFMLLGTNDLLSEGGNHVTDAHFNSVLASMFGYNGSTFDGTSGTFDKIWNAMTTARTDSQLIVLEMPTWSPDHTNHQYAADFAYMTKFNQKLHEWANSQSNKAQITIVNPNPGIVDVANTTKPGAGVASMFLSDHLHPSAQGELLIAGNVAKQLGYAGRTVGLARASHTEPGSTTWDAAGDTSITVTDGAAALTFAENAFSTTDGYTIDFGALYGNGYSGGWSDKANGLTVQVGDGYNIGTLTFSEAYVMWGGTVLYSRDNSQAGDNFRIAYVNQSVDEEDHVSTGYYVWMGDQLIGEALSGVSGSFNGISLTSTGANGTVKNLTWSDTAYAPTTTLYDNPDTTKLFHLEQANALPTHTDTPQGIKEDIEWQTTTDKFALPNGQSSTEKTIYKEFSSNIAANYTGAANADYEGDIGMHYTGTVDMDARQSVLSVYNATVTGNVYVQFDNPNTVYNSFTNTNKLSVTAGYNGNITGSYTAVYNAGIFNYDVRGGEHNNANATIGGGSYSYVNGGTFKANVMGGGVTGTIDGGTHVTVSGGEIAGSVYGGGIGGTINDGTYVTITGGTIAGNVIGGGTGGTIKGGTHVTVEGILPIIKGNISADNVTLKDVVNPLEYVDGFDSYKGTITATNFTLDNYKAGEMLATVTAANLAATNGTETVINHLTTTAGTAITVDEDSSLTLGDVKLSTAISNDGELTLNGNVLLDMMTATRTDESYVDGNTPGNGFYSSKSSVSVFATDHMGNVNVSAANMTYKGADGTFDTTTGVFTTNVTKDLTTFYINAGSENLTTVTGKSADATVTMDNATRLVVDEAMNTSRIIVKEGATGTLDIQSGVTVTSDGTAKHVTLTGSGVYALQDNTWNLLDTLVTEGEDHWKGIVRVSNVTSGVSVSDKISLLATTPEGRVELKNVTAGYLGNDSHNDAIITAGIILTGSANDGTGTGFAITNGYSNHSQTFTGSVSGHGDLVEKLNPGGTGNQDYVFQGDISGWDGSFKFETSKGAKTVTYSGNAWQVASGISQTSTNAHTLDVHYAAEHEGGMQVTGNVERAANVTRALNLHVDEDATFTGEVKNASSFTVAEDKTATLQGEGKYRQLGNVTMEDNASLNIMNIAEAAKLSVGDVTIGAGATMGVYTGSDVSSLDEAALVIASGKTLTASGEGATLNGNLEMAAGSHLDVSATGGMGLLMGSTVTLNKGAILDDYDSTTWSGWADGTKYALFTGVDGLDIGSGTGTAAIDYTQWVDASEYFTNIDEANRYFLCYGGAPANNQNGVLQATFDGSNVGMVYVMVMPEPTTGTLSLLALCALAARRRRK